MAGSEQPAGSLRGADLYEAVVEAQNRMGEGIVVVDLGEQAILFANDAFCSMCGYALEELRTLGSFFELVPPEVAVGLEERRRRRLEGLADPDHFSTTVRRRDGTDFRAEIAASPVDETDPSFLVILVRDVTARTESERLLRDSEARWRKIANTVPMVLWTVDAEGKLTLGEGRGLSLLGLERDQLLGRSVFDVYGDSPEIVDAHHRALAGEVAEYTVEVGGVWFHSHVVPVQGANGIEGAVGVAVDVTDRRVAEAALEESEERNRSILSALNDGVLLMSAEGKVLASNPAAERILSVREPIAGAHVGAGVGAVVNPDGTVLAVHDFPTQITLRTGEPQSEEILGMRREDGSTLWLSINTQGLFRPGEELPYAVVASFTDVTERRRVEEELRHLADHDALTGLPNRRRFNEELHRHLSYVARYGGHGAALLLDLDNFKLLNDTLGHKAGDQYLIGVAHILSERLRETDVVARLGGDEFGVLLPAARVDQARTVAENLLEALRGYAPVIEGQPVKMTTSIGVACFAEGPAVQPDELLSAADVAMYDAKEAGRDRYAIASTDELDEQSLRARMHWVERIRRALTHGNFKLFAQAILDVETREISQYELLLRLEDDDGKIVPANSFLGTAERFDLIQEIDRWVLRQAIDLIAAHRDHGRELRVEVNISAKSVGDQEIPRLIETELARRGVDPSMLILEITETAAIANMDEAVDFGTRLSRIGCGFALDDFGRGFGSFYYLKHLPLTYLKIDGDFISNLPTSLIDQQVVKAVVQVAKALGLKTVAEYVGNEATMLALKEYGVDFAQGYYVAQPRALSPPSSGFL